MGVTFALVVAAGGAILWLTMRLVAWLGAPDWVVALPWLASTAGALAWVLGRPTPAVLTDDDDDSWVGYAIRLVMVGGESPRSRATRAVTAVLFGAPVVWSLTLLLLLELTGIF